MLLQKIELAKSTIKVYMLRTDLLDPLTGGNKFFKLKYNMEEAKRLKHDTILTFGGSYSNHIAATAAVGKSFGIKTIGIIRGDEEKELNETLKTAMQNGMQLHFMSREKYRIKEDENFINNLKDLFGDFYLIPEGGSNYLAVQGCREIRDFIEIDFDYICCPVGTAGTFAGISISLKPNEKLIGFSCLQNGGFLTQKAEELMSEYFQKLNAPPITFDERNQIILDYHFGGYGKINQELIEFKQEFEEKNNIELDYVYTSKMMYGIKDLIKKKFFKANSTVIAIHTGGIQGNSGFKLKMSGN